MKPHSDPICFLIAILSVASAPIALTAQGYESFEARQCHPIELAGSVLLAVNSPKGSLAVFDLVAGAPVFRAEIPVGVEPVTVRARSAAEAWVVNEVSDSISVVDLENGLVRATLPTPDEPSDVVFVNGFAVVSCARANLLRVLDATSHAEVTTIPLMGNYPTSLALSPDESKLYVSFLLSGNGTTTLAPDRAPAQPLPGNPALPAPPDTGKIVLADHPGIPYKVLDHDVAVIDVATWAVDTYLGGAGTVLHHLSVHPTSGELFVLNTDARNLVRFEPELRGHVVDHRITRYAADGSGKEAHDLNAGFDYSVLPNPTARAVALAEPTGLAFAGANHAWIAAFGSDRVARVNLASGAVIERVDLRLPGETSAEMRGPRALAFDEGTGKLYVLNKISNTLAVVATQMEKVESEHELGAFDPIPADVKAGRGYLFDARLSGNGTLSCATCHVDADRDGIAWDLGVPSGVMTVQIGKNLANDHTDTLVARPMHPMKGPMVTQTMRNLEGGAPFHWRGDRPTLADFNVTFVDLLGGEALDAGDFASLEAYLMSLRHHPNPYRKLDDSLPTSIRGGNPAAGEVAFNLSANHCGLCHAGPRGSDNNIDDFRLTDTRDPVKNPPLQTTYQRFGFDGAPGGVNVTGYGMNRNGTGSRLPTVHFYELETLGAEERRNVAAFVLAFGTGTHAAVGQSRTVTSVNRGQSSLLEDLTVLEAEADAEEIDLVVEGIAGAASVSRRFDPAQNLYVDGVNPGLARSALVGALGADEAVTFTALRRGQAVHRLAN
jgi:DNA-binding beta-propeller fold protein YncE